MTLRPLAFSDAPIILSWIKDKTAFRKWSADRYPEPSKAVIRFGFVIVDDSKRGKGYGKQMLQLAIQKARQDFGAKEITLGVFDNNPSALHCYRTVGFKVNDSDSYLIDGEEWTEKEMRISF